MKTALPMITKKECGTCTKCCEGWLKGNIRGHEMYLGKPCFFLEIGKGCGDYVNRPENPCKGFECAWLDIEEMPDKFKPEITGVIAYLNPNNGNPSFFLEKAPNSPKADFLSWIIVYARSRNLNIVWPTEDSVWWLGNDDFCKQMEIKFKDV